MPVDRPPDVPDKDPAPTDSGPAPADISYGSPGSTDPPVDAHQPADEPPSAQNPARNADARATELTEEPPSPDERSPAEPRTRQEHAQPLPDTHRPSETEPPGADAQVGPSAEQRPGPTGDSPESDTGTETNTPTDRNTTQPATPAAPDVPTSKDPQAPARPDHPAPEPKHEALLFPISDKEWSDHITDVLNGLAGAREAGLRTDRLYTIDRGREIWSEERELLHDSLLQELYSAAASVPCDHRAVIAGGLGGAGKTTVLTQHAEIDLSQFLMINPDIIKEEMARRGMIPEVDGLSPMEASDLAHEESSYLARQLALLAQADGKNLIWDITMSRESSTKERIANLRVYGYSEINSVFVDIPIETSVKRTESRHRQGHDEWLSDSGLGGRYVPSEVIRSQADETWGSKNRRTFEIVKGELDAWALYDNSIDGRPPVLISASRQATRCQSAWPREEK